jgi:hypothetical protein
MSGNTFTLTVGEGASIDVGIVQVIDPVNIDLIRFYVSTVRLRTSLQELPSQTRLFRLAVIQPSSPPVGYSSAVSFIQLNGPPVVGRTFTAAGSGPFNGLYSFTQTAVSLIAQQIIQPQNVSFQTKLTLQTSLNNGVLWTNVPFTGTGSTYSFDIGDGTNRFYDTKAAESPNPISGPNIIVGGAATLYFKQNYNTVWTSAQLNVNGTSTVSIGGDLYNALYDSSNNLVTPGNDFTLYVPQSANTEEFLNGLVQDVQTHNISLSEFNLMDLDIVTTGPQSGNFLNGTTGNPVSKTTERGEDISFYAVLPWSNVTVDKIVDASGVDLPVNDTATGTYYNIFTYQGSTYTFTIVTHQPSGKKNIKMNVQTSRGAASVTIRRIFIRPGTPSGGTKVL